MSDSSLHTAATLSRERASSALKRFLHSGGLGLGLVVVLTLGTSACTFPWSKKHYRVFVPPPAKPRPPLPTKIPDIAPPEQQVEYTATMVPELYPLKLATVAPPAAPVKRPPVAAAPKPAPAPTVEPTPPPPPRLGQIFTAQQLQEYNRSLDESLDRVRKTLAVVERRRLNPEQNEIANRIRLFQRQAEEAREADLVTAVSLARRADVLAQDLLARSN